MKKRQQHVKIRFKTGKNSETMWVLKKASNSGILDNDSIFNLRLKSGKSVIFKKTKNGYVGKIK